jgi:hypothetical protein
MMAAMYFSAEDAFAFSIYMLLLSLSYLATIGTNDLVIMWPHLEHWFEPRIACFGIYAIIFAILGYFHQGVELRDHEADKLTEQNDNDLFL